MEAAQEMAVGIVVAVVVLAFLVWAIARTGRQAPPPAVPPPPRAPAPHRPRRSPLLEYTDRTPVTRVIDGDTFCIHVYTDIIDGDTLEPFTREEKIRVIGIDSPETVHPDKPVEWYGPQASARAKQLLTGQLVRLAQDPTQSRRDQYGRLLAYAELPDGSDFGELMIASGHASEYTHGGKFYLHRDRYMAAEFAARSARRGMWGRY